MSKFFYYRNTLIYLIAPSICSLKFSLLSSKIPRCFWRFPDTSPTDISPTGSSPTDTSPTDISPTRHIPDGHFPDQTHPRWTFSQPDTSPTDTSPTRHIPDQTYPRPDKCLKMFSWVDASLSGHFPDQLNTSNNHKYLKKDIVRDNFGNIHALVRTLEI